MMNEQQAVTLGGIVRTALMLLEGQTAEVGKSIRLELLVPMAFGHGESIEHGEAGILPATLAIEGELLRVDDRFVLDPAIQRIFRLFLRSVFEPPVVGGGKFEITEREDGLIFMRKKNWNDDWQTHSVPFTSNDQAQGAGGGLIAGGSPGATG